MAVLMPEFMPVFMAVLMLVFMPALMPAFIVLIAWSEGNGWAEREKS